MTVTLEQLEQAYRDEINCLIDLQQQRDYSPAGDEEFRKQTNRVWWAKEALIMASVTTSSHACHQNS